MKHHFIKKITITILTAAMTVQVFAMPASAAIGSQKDTSGWRSTVLLPSAGVSYALSAKKTSLRDVENKLVRTGKMSKVKSAKSAKVDAATSAAASTEIAGEATVASNSDGVSLGAAEAYQNEVNAIVDTTLTPVQEREKAVVQRAQLQKQADVVNTEEVSESEAIKASAKAPTTTDADLNKPIVRGGEDSTTETTAEATSTEASSEEASTEASTETTEAADEASSESTEQAEEAASEDSSEAASEPESNLVVSSASNYVNIRKEPNTDAEIVGKLYADAVGTILEETGDGWVKIQSGSVTGYVNKDYLLSGSAAEQKAAEVGQDQAVITTTTLRVRAAASVESDVISLIGQGSKLDIIGEEGNFYKVSTDDGDGYVSKDYADVETIYPDAVSIEEEKAEEEAKRAEEEKKAAASGSSSGSSTSSSSSSTKSTQSAEGASKGQQVVNYAMQFIGNPYVWGGSSLTNGTDCSGFTMAVYAHFGVSLPHYDGAQRSCGTAVNSLAEAQPGDLICYYGHVGIYIGNGQIVHASNPRTGITTGTATYRQIAAIRRIFN